MSNEYLPSLQVGAGTTVQPQATTATIAAFSLVNTETGWPTILAEYPVSDAEVAFSIRRPLQKEVRKNTSFALAVRFENEDGDTIRYILHRPDGINGLLYSDYSGETIEVNSPVIEVWGLKDQGTASISVDIVLTIKTMTYQKGDTVSICGQYPGKAWTLTPTAFVSTPYGPDNPFADAMMLAKGA